MIHATEVGAYEAKTHLPRLLLDVAAGHRITITKHGVPIAMLVPPTLEKEQKINQVIDDLRAFRKTQTLGRVSLRSLIDEGRR